MYGQLKIFDHCEVRCIGQWTSGVMLAAALLATVPGFAQTTPATEAPVAVAPAVPAPVAPAPVAPPPVAPAAPAVPSPASPAPAAPAVPAPVVPAPAPVAPATPAPAPPTPAPAVPAAPVVPPKTEIAPLPESSPALDPSMVPFELAARPVALVRGKANWDDGYKVIHDMFKKVSDALAAEKIPVTGKPLAVFIETNDVDFKYEIMIPIEKAPEGKTGLPGDIVFGMSPAGKVLKFQHRGAYDDIDSTYEAITAYLDEKGYESKDLFAEEYLNEAKGSDDTNLQLDVYVYLK